MLYEVITIYGTTIAKLLRGVVDMEAIRFLQSLNTGDVRNNFV